MADLWSKDLVWHPCQVIEICLLDRHFNMAYYAFLQLGVWMGTTWLLWKLSELFGEGVGSCNESAPCGGGVVTLLVTSCYWDAVNQGSNRPLGNKRCYLSLLCLFVALYYLTKFCVICDLLRNRYTTTWNLFVNPLTPKIWLLILPSSCYTFPWK